MTLLTETLSQIKSVENPELAKQIQDRLDNLTKPPGSLGRLEEIALQYGLARGTARLKLDRKAMFVFCADHGIAAEGVSAYPPEVTRQMVRNFVSGGAAINVLCRQFGIDTTIVDMGVDAEFEPELPIMNRKIARGTRNFLREPAMTEIQAVHAIEVGIQLAREAAVQGCDIVGAGEMGIGNTTASTAIVAAAAGRDAEWLAGPGTGLSQTGIAHKADVVRRALILHRPDPALPLSVLAAVGGFEIAAMAGLMLGAPACRLAVAVDGFISSAASLIAVRMEPRVLPYLFFSHCSSEPGHAILLETLPARPLLSLDLRLGEGTGAALGISILDSAMRLYNQMATFESAEVSGKNLQRINKKADS